MLIVAAIRVLLELRRFAQFRDAVNGEARTLQLQCRGGLSCGRNQLLQTKAGFEDFVLAFLLGVDVVGGLICIGQGFVVVDLVAEVALGIGQIVSIPRFAAVQLAALSYGGILVFVGVILIFAVIHSEICILSGAFQLLIKLWVLSSNVQFSVAVDGQHQPGGTLDQIVATHVQVGKSQLSVCNLGGGYQPVFLQNGQVIRIPAAVGKDSGVPNGRTVGIGDF